MNPRRLLRTGTVGQTAHGCTTIEVSVPCSACRVGYCRGRRASEMRLDTPVNVAIGKPVELSISAPGLNQVSGWLFGPTLVWVLLLAQVSAAVSPARLHPVVFGCIGFLGVIGTLWLGRYIGGACLSKLDLRFRSG
jgi:hypothetical protein